MFVSILELVFVAVFILAGLATVRNLLKPGARAKLTGTLLLVAMLIVAAVGIVFALAM